MRRCTPRFLLTIVALCGIAHSGFPQSTSSHAPVGVASTASAPAGAWSWEELKSAEFEKRDAFTAQIRTLNAPFRDQLAQVRAGFQETAATESEKKAMRDLDAAEVDFDEKLKALDNVSAETWETVKSNLLSSWLNLQESFRKARPSE